MGKIYQLHVIGLHDERKTIDIATSEEDFNNTTVSTLKEKLIQKFPEYKGVDMTLIYTDKKLEDNDTFSQHQMHDHATIMVVSRLPGGSAVCLAVRVAA
ncbi:uncharacterized protein zgc:194655 [Trichomycterus rosablanca]|uniref:uncharacterized protein zgc:194655 n=1 Tax=Trichomycterus rosablanca TaxID=2290929 RepID=UPI002F3529B3